MLELWYFSNTLFAPFDFKLFGFHLGLNVLILLPISIFFLIQNRHSGSTLLKKIALYYFLPLGVLYAISAVGPCEDDRLKLLASAPIAITFIIIGGELGATGSHKRWLHLQKMALIILMLALMSFLLEVAFPQLFPAMASARAEYRWAGIFDEPSHAAYYLFPWVAVLLAAQSNRYNLFGLIFLFLMVLFSRSTTLYALMMAWILYEAVYVRGGLTKNTVYELLVITLTFILGSSFNRIYFVDSMTDRIRGIWDWGTPFIKHLFDAIIQSLHYFMRLIHGSIMPTVPTPIVHNPVQPVTHLIQATHALVEPLHAIAQPVIQKMPNLSSMVYVQGWQDAWHNLIRTRGLGLGFNMMGCQPLPVGSMRMQIQKLFNLQLNVTDGSFLFSKVISELGVLGIVGFVGLLWWMMKFQAKINTVKRGNPMDQSIAIAHIQMLFMLMFFIDAFLRSVGYFNGEFMYLIPALAGSIFWYKSHASGSKSI